MTMQTVLELKRQEKILKDRFYALHSEWKQGQPKPKGYDAAQAAMIAATRDRQAALLQLTATM